MITPVPNVCKKKLVIYNIALSVSCYHFIITDFSENLYENIDHDNNYKQVLRHRTLSGQVKELREWFKAWKSSNHTVRDYRKYFKVRILKSSFTSKDTVGKQENFKFGFVPT